MQHELQQFCEFCRAAAGPFCDFEVVENEGKWLNTLLVPESESYFKLIGKQRSGSLICFWQLEDNIPLAQQPIVWLDSEGSIYSIIAARFPDFLSLLYYDTGAIYDVVSAWKRYWDAPANEISPAESFTEEQLNLYVEMCQELYPFYQSFTKWLRQDVGIKPAGNPAILVGEAIEGFPELNIWLSTRNLKR